MYTSKHLVIALLLCNLAAGLLLLTSKPVEIRPLSSWEELDNNLLAFIQDFGFPPHRVRIRSTEVNDRLTRKTITVDIHQGYPQTEFHRLLSREVAVFGADTYANVQFPERLSTIHIMFDGTIVRTIRFRWANE